MSGGDPQVDEGMRAVVDRVLDEARRTNWHWRYLVTGKVAHALRPPIAGAAACGVDGWSTEWLGTGSQDEYERAATLPRCLRCLRRIVESN